MVQTNGGIDEQVQCAPPSPPKKTADILLTDCDTHTHKPTNQETKKPNKQTNKRTKEQTKQTNTQASKQANKQRNKQTNKQKTIEVAFGARLSVFSFFISLHKLAIEC